MWAQCHQLWHSRKKRFPICSTTMEPKGKTNERVQQTMGTGFTQPIHRGHPHQLKLEPPVKYLGQRRLGVQAWLMKQEWYLRLSRFSMEEWVEIAALRLDGAAATWAKALLLEVSEKKRMPYTWAEFRTHTIARFESVTKNEEVRWELRKLCQTRRVVGYTTKLQEQKCRLLTMMDKERSQCI